MCTLCVYCKWIVEISLNINIGLEGHNQLLVYRNIDIWIETVFRLCDIWPSYRLRVIILLYCCVVVMLQYSVHMTLPRFMYYCSTHGMYLWYLLWAPVGMCLPDNISQLWKYTTQAATFMHRPTLGKQLNGGNKWFERQPTTYFVDYLFSKL